MKIRAIIFDIYGTILDVGVPPPDADVRWQGLFRDLFHSEPVMSRLDFSVACSKVIARLHEAARALDIPRPEVWWPAVAAEVLPGLSKLHGPDQTEFLYRLIQTGHTTRVSPAAAAALRLMKERQYLLGIASNAQDYTLRELREGLAPHELGMDLFDQNLCFWSFENGFSKPDPHVFQILTARLGARGMVPAEILMIGDRLDNDIAPARAHGWKTWRITALPSTGGANEGDWHQLADRLV